MADLIDRAALLEKKTCLWDDALGWTECVDIDDIEAAATADAVEVDVLKAWLYEIAMNNTDNYLGDACEEIISRLEGLRVFAKERRTDG